MRQYAACVRPRWAKFVAFLRSGVRVRIDATGFSPRPGDASRPARVAKARTLSISHRLSCTFLTWNRRATGTGEFYRRCSAQAPVARAPSAGQGAHRRESGGKLDEAADRAEQQLVAQQD